MIQRLVHFALHQRFITVALALLLTAGGIVAFSRLPIEAYPDVVDVEVDVITIWPGHAAEEVERLVTIALEKELNGIAHVTFIRSFSICWARWPAPLAKSTATRSSPRPCRWWR